MFARGTDIFDPHEIYRSVTPLDVVRVNRTIFHNNRSVRRYYNTRMEGRCYSKRYIII